MYQRYGHQADRCRTNPANKTPGDEVPKDTAAVVTEVKKKKKKKKKGVGKTAIEVPVIQEDPPEEVTEASEEEDAEESEEDSPKKPPSNRASRVGFARKAIFRNCENKSSLNKMLNSIEAEDLKEWGDGAFRALRAKSDKTPDHSVGQK